MGQTVGAIEYRADVKGRAKEAIVERKDAVVDKMQGAVSRVTGALPDVGGVASSAAATIGDAASNVASTVGDAGSSVASSVESAIPDRSQVKQTVSVAQSNPLGLAVGSVAVGFLAGMLIPSTRTEDRKLGPFADQVKSQAREIGQEALEHGKDVAQDAALAASETVQQQGQEHGQELALSLKKSAQQVGTTVSSGDRTGSTDA